MFAINLVGKACLHYQTNNIYFQSDKIWFSFLIKINILIHTLMAIISLQNSKFKKDRSGS